MAKFLKIEDAKDGQPDYLFDCPGCGNSHGVWTQNHNVHTGAKWQFNGDVNKPTVTPSILVRHNSFRSIVDGIGVTGTEYEHVCHTFITDGRIQF